MFYVKEKLNNAVAVSIELGDECSKAIVAGGRNRGHK